MQASIGSASVPALAAAVSEAGRPRDGRADLDKAGADRRDDRRRTRTGRPFGVNLLLEWPQEERLDAALEAGVRIVSLAWGDPAPHLNRVHEVR